MRGDTTAGQLIWLNVKNVAWENSLARMKIPAVSSFYSPRCFKILSFEMVLWCSFTSTLSMIFFISEPCPAGQYKDTGMLNCAACPAGAISSESGVGLCLKCPQGTAVNTGLTECGNF